MSTGFTVARAAEVPGAGGSAANGKPKLFVDFLGDTKTGVLPMPNTTAPSDTKWKYSSTNGTTDGKTIFWVGVGIDNVDEFVLANAAGEKGLSSLELGFYYDERYVKPYTGDATTSGTTTDEKYRTILNNNNIGAGKNQWSSDYEVAAAVSAADPAVATTDRTVNDPATQEYTPPAGWKMTYLSIHKKDGTTGANRFANATAAPPQTTPPTPPPTPNYTGTQYVAMIPFVLQKIDTTTNPALCFRLAMNAFVFTAGSGAKGHDVYGAWSKDTGKSEPDHNLKLMLDFTGDLNIFTGAKDSTTHQAALRLDKGGRLDNTAELSIWEDKAPNPAKINTDGDALTGLLGGTKMQLKLNCLKDVQVTVTVTDSTGAAIYTKTHPYATATTTYTEYFTMPADSVTVTVKYESTTTGSAEYDAELDIEHAGSDTDLVKNTVTMSGSDSTGVTQSVNTDGDKLALPSGTVVTLTVTTNSEYNVAVEVTRAVGGSTVTHQTVTDQKVYTFTMPAGDVIAKVTFTKADRHEAKLVVKNLPANTPIADNKAKLSHTVPEEATPLHETETVFEGYTGTKDALTLRDGRIVTVTIPAGYSSAYAVKSVMVSPKTAGAFTAFAANTVTANQTYNFIMPKFDAEVTVTYEKVQDYKVELNIVGAPAGGSVTLSGTDARGSQSTSTDKGIIALFLNSTVNIDVVVPDGYYVGRSVTRPNGDPITPGGTSPNWSFVLNQTYNDPVNDKTTVTVTFTQVAKPKYDATIDFDYAPLTVGTSQLNSATWQGTTANPIKREAGDRVVGEVNVDSGFYIQQVIGVTAGGIAVPLTVSGNGYNNGVGTGTTPVAVSFTMPAEHVAVTVIFAEGTPPAEPGYRATLVLNGDPLSTATPFELKNSAGATAAGGQFVTATAGERVTGVFRMATDCYVTKVEVTADVPGVTAGWQWAAPGEIALTMPAANVTVKVTVEKLAIPPAFTLTLEKQEYDANGALLAPPVTGNTANLSLAPSGGSLSIGGVATATSTATAGEGLTLTVAADSNYEIAAVLLTDSGGTYPAALATGALGTNATTAAFAMPGDDLKITVIYGDVNLVVPPDMGDGQHALTLSVRDPDNIDGTAQNTAQVYINGVAKTPVLGKNGTFMFPAAPGDVVEVKAATAQTYSVDSVALTPSALGITPTPGGGGSYTFLMPDAAAVATVTFRKAAAAAYTANLILRGSGSGDGSFTGYDQKVYSISAPAGTPITAYLSVKDGSYIQSVTVTPAALGVETSLTGAFARQEAYFAMPAADCIVNVTLEQGWPDSVDYSATLKVSDPTNTAQNTAKLTNTATNLFIGPLSGVAQGAVAAREGTAMEAEVLSAPGYVPELSVLAADGTGVAHTYTQATGKLAFTMPAGHVTVEARYRKAAAATPYNITLHPTGDATDAAQIAASGGNSIAWPAATTTTAQAGEGITVTATPGANRYVESLEVYSGGRLLSTGGFTMPAADVDVYIKFAATQPTYRAQIVVNGMVSGAVGGSAFLRTDPTNPGAAILPGVTPGTKLEAFVAVNPGYIIKSVLMVPRGGNGTLTPAANLNQSQAVPFTMPANDVIIYVDYAVDPAAVYTATLTVDHAAPSMAISGNQANISSPRQPTAATADMSTPATAPASAGEVVTVNFAPDTGYVVDSYTVVTATGGVSVPCTAISGGFTFAMPAGNATVKVVYTNVAPTPRTATLHVTDNSGGVAGLQVTIEDDVTNRLTWPATSSPLALTTAATKQISVTATLPTNTYVAAAYALQGDTVYPFTMPTGWGTSSSTGTFYMPAADVDVYVVLASATTQPPQDYSALLLVNGPAGAGGATMTLDGSSPARSVIVQSGDTHQYISAQPGSAFTVTVTVNSGYVVDRVVGSQTALTPTGQPNEYHFTLPALPTGGNAGAIVTLKQSTAVGKDLTLHVGHAPGTATPNTVNAATVAYTDAATATTFSKTVTAGDASGVLASVPSGRSVTLTVTPQAGYYVDAAYALNGTTLVQLSKVLEGTTATDTATLTMPAAATDVYVFYKQGTPPADRWHNVILLATDEDAAGVVTNTGDSTADIKVGGSAAAVTGTVQSDATPTAYYNVAAGTAVGLHATPGAGYGFGAVSATPNLVFSPASDPNKVDYSFAMPGGNVAVIMHFKPGTATAKLTLTGSADQAATNVWFHLTLDGNNTGKPDIEFRHHPASASLPAVPAGTKATIEAQIIMPVNYAEYSAWAEFITTPAGSTTPQSTWVPLTATLGISGKVFTGTITTAATDGEVKMHLLKAPKVIVQVKHDNGVAVNPGNTVSLSYTGAPSVVANSANAAGAGVSMPIPGGTAPVSLTVSPVAGYQPTSVTVSSSNSGGVSTPPALAGDILTDATGTDPKTATFTMPTDITEVITVVVTFGNELTTRLLTAELLQDGGTPPAVHGTATITQQSNTTGTPDISLSDTARTGTAQADIGKTVTVTVAPDTDYRAKIKLSSTDATGQTVVTYLPVTGNVATLLMPNRDAALEIEFVKGYTATLVLSDTTPAPGNTSTAQMDTNENPVRSATVNSTTTSASLAQIQNGTELTITPTIAAGSRSILKGIMVTENDSGSTTFLTTVPYTYTVKSDVTVTVLAEPDIPPHSYLAAVELKGDYSVLGNKADIVNKTDTAARKGSIWTTAKGAERVELTLDLAAGYYASISAKELTGGAEVPLLNADQPPVPRATLTESGVYHFDMPADNVAIVVTYFEKDYVAQLFVVDETAISGNGAAISYTDRYGQLQSINYDRGVLVGLQETNPVTAAFTLGANIVSVGVVANNLKTGASLATESVVNTNKYEFNMPDADVAVSAVFGLAGKGLRIAAMQMEAKDTVGGTTIDITKTQNTASIKNLTPPSVTTTGARAAAPYSIGLDDGYKKNWVTGYPGDLIEVTFQTEQNGVNGGTLDFYAEVTAETTGTLSSAVTVLQQGALGAGTARFVMPDENVQIKVTFDTRLPTVGGNNGLDMVVTKHEGVVGNHTNLTDGITNLALTPTAGNTTDLTGAWAGGVGANTLLTLATAADSKYRVASAVLEAVDGSGNVLVSLPLTLNSAGKVQFKMPDAKVRLTVTYATNFNATLHLSSDAPAGAELAASIGTPPKVDTNGAKITGIPTGAVLTATAQVPPPASGIYASAALVTTAGGGTQFMSPVLNQQHQYGYIMGSEDVDVSLVYSPGDPDPDIPDPDRVYVAAASYSYETGSAVDMGNTIALNNTTATLDKGLIWAEAGGGDTVALDLTVAAGYNAQVTAKDRDGNSVALTYNGKTADSLTVTAGAADLSGSVTFTMPSVNVQVQVTYSKGFTATLSVPTKNATGAIYSVTATGNSGNAQNDGEKLVDLAGGETISAAVTPGTGNEVSAVVITKESGSVFATPGENGTDPYTYTMPHEHIIVTPIVSAVADDLYIAAVDTVGAQLPDSTVMGIVNGTDAARDQGTIWAAGKQGHQMEVTFVVGSGLYAQVNAVRTDTSAPIDVLQLGVTDTTSGKAYFVMPDSNVQVTVTYSTTTPAAVQADLISTGHGGKGDNLSTVTYASASYPLTPVDTSNVTQQITSVQPGDALSMLVERNPTYSIKAVELSLTGVTNGPVISIVLDAANAAAVLVPTKNLTLTFIYDDTPPTPQPWDPDGLADTAVTPNLDVGHLTAVNHDTLPDMVNVTVPVLWGVKDKLTLTPGYHSVKDTDFEVDFRFYYDKAGVMTELVAGTDITVGVIDYTTVSTTIGGTSYTGAKFELAGVTDDIKKLIADGGVIFITATKQMVVSDATARPESAKTQLVLPGPGFGPRPYDPGNAAKTTDPVLKEGYIYAANYGDRAELDIPILIDHKDVWGNADSADLEYKFYVQTGLDGEGKPVYLPLTTENMPDGTPADIVLTRGTDLVETPNPDGTFPDYQGVHFTLELKDGHTSAAAQKLSAMLDNGSSIDGTDKQTRLFVTATLVDKTAPLNPKPGPESDKTEIWLPSYKRIHGTITSYAPTHLGVVSLYAETATPGTFETEAALSYTMPELAGDGRWRQGFELRSSELEDGDSYRLVVEKVSHITREAILSAVTFNTTTLELDLGDLTLYCGDINADGTILLDDRTWVQRAMGQAVDTSTEGYENTLAYLADLDGDGTVTLADLTILARHMGMTAADYPPLTITTRIKMYMAANSAEDLPLGPVAEEPFEEPTEEELPPEQTEEPEPPAQGGQEELPAPPPDPELPPPDPDTPPPGQEQPPDVILPPPLPDAPKPGGEGERPDKDEEEPPAITGTDPEPDEENAGTETQE